MKQKKLILVDGTFLACKYFFGMPRLENDQGKNINAFVGISRFLLGFYQKRKSQPIYLGVAFESPSEKNFRKQILSTYKGNRGKFPEELAIQLPMIKDAINAFDFHCLECEGFEADDVIATYAQHAQSQNLQVDIYSFDKDVFQLMNDNVQIINPIKSQKVTKEDILNKYGVEPHQMLDLQILTGDSSDNVPGISGIGNKTAAKLLQQYQNIHNLLQNLHLISSKFAKVIENEKDKIFQNSKLLKLITNAPVQEITWTETSYDQTEQKIKNFLFTHKLNSIIKNLYRSNTRPLL